jgi:hypothetical protein
MIYLQIGEAVREDCALAIFEGHRADMHNFLVRMHELSGGDRTQLLDMWEVGDSLNFSRDEINMIVQHLVVENLIDLRTHNGRVAITTHGVLEVEEGPSGGGDSDQEPAVNDAAIDIELETLEPLAEPEPQVTKAPEEIVPKVAFGVEDLPGEVSAVVKEPGQDADLKAAFKGEKTDEEGLSGFVRSLRRRLPTLNLGSDDYGELLADLGTMELQMGSPRPNEKIMVECVSTIGRILRETENEEANKLIEELAELL